MTKNILPGKAIIQIWRRDKELYKQAKTKRVQHHKTDFTRNIKGTSLRGEEKTTTKHVNTAKRKIPLLNANI